MQTYSACLCFLCLTFIYFELSWVDHNDAAQYQSQPGSSQSKSLSVSWLWLPRILLKYSVDEENIILCTIVIQVSSFQVGSRVEKHFWHHCLFMSSVCFFFMLKTLQATFPMSVALLICNCTCQRAQGMEDKHTLQLCRGFSQQMLSVGCLESAAKQLYVWVLTSHCRKDSQSRS